MLHSKRSLSIFAILLIVITLFMAACNNCKPTEKDTTQAGNPVGETDLYENLPDMDYKKTEFHILVLSQLEEFYDPSDEKSTETVSVAAFKRNRNVEDRYNVKIVYTGVPGHYDTMELFMNTIRTSALADVSDFDIVCPNYYYGMALATENVYLNMLEMKYNDFTKPWWTNGYNSQATYKGRLFAAVGDFSVSQLSGLLVVYYNQNLADQYHMGNLYELVDSGRWTFDVMNSMAMQVSGDLNHDNFYDENDLYGYIMTKWSMRAFVYAFDIPLVSIDQNTQEPYLSFYTSKAIDAYQRLYQFVQKRNYTCYLEKNDTLTHMFMSDQALFYGDSLSVGSKLRSMESDFGVLPMPKYDENQTRYISSSAGCDVYAIPVSVRDPEMSSLILEALNIESYKHVVPAYFENSLKFQTSRDEDSQRMMEIVKSTVYYDFGYIYSTSLNNFAERFAANIIIDNDNIASWYEMHEGTVLSCLERLLEALESIE